jgi:hypothetical protein
MFNNIFFFKSFLIFFLFTVLFGTANAQEKKEYKLACIGFYNVENLFDTIDSKDTHDEEFLPDGKKVWNSEKYYKKLDKLAEVISQIGDEYIKGGPHILGLSEIENRLVMEDLIKTNKLKDSDYAIVHYQSPDERGVDVGLIYRKAFFEVISSSAHELHFDFDTADQTRSQLLVTGLLKGEKIHIIVNHWPSRGGGELTSRPKRKAAGDLSRKLVDSLLNIDKNAKIIVMGDLNDNPDDESVKENLYSGRNPDKLKKGQLYNPYYNVYKKGVGSNAYRDAWSLFDQLIFSQALLSDDRSSYVYWKSNICRKKFMISTEGRYEGYPKRTFSFDLFQNGYSDHFPVYMFLIKEK